MRTIASDFDGVWTDHRAEADALLEFLITRLATLRDEALDRTATRVMTWIAEALNDPVAHGWAPQGRVCAFIDEDPFFLPAAVCWVIEQGMWGAESYRDAILAADYPSIPAFADASLREATERFVNSHPPSTVTGLAEIFARLGADGNTAILIVSTSPASKVTAWLSAAGVDVGGDAVRVVGGAKKWLLGDTGQTMTFASRSVLVDRPAYRVLLERAQPDVVIGDVLSTDLALPAFLRAHHHPAAPRRLVLRRHPHTPEWVLDACKALDIVIADTPWRIAEAAAVQR